MMVQCLHQSCTDLAAAPESLLKFVRCQCKLLSKNPCGTNIICSCRLKCVTACGEKAIRMLKRWFLMWTKKVTTKLTATSHFVLLNLNMSRAYIFLRRRGHATPIVTVQTSKFSALLKIAT